MPITIKKRLILVEAKPINFKSKETGEMVSKWRYKFIDPDMKYHVGYDDLGVYSSDVETIENWDDKKAKDYLWSLTEFNGETKEKLYIQGIELKNKPKK